MSVTCATMRLMVCSGGAGPASVAELQGALEVVVGRLVDRAFATQTAVVHFAHTLAQRARGLAAANEQLRKTRQVGLRSPRGRSASQQNTMSSTSHTACNHTTTHPGPRP